MPQEKVSASRIPLSPEDELGLCEVFSTEEIARLEKAGGVTLEVRDVFLIEVWADAFFEDQRFQNAKKSKEYAAVRASLEQFLASLKTIRPTLVTDDLEAFRKELLLYEEAGKPGKGRPDNWDLICLCHWILRGFRDFGGGTALPSNNDPPEVADRCPIIRFTMTLVAIMLAKAERGYWPGFRSKLHRSEVMAELRALQAKNAAAWVRLFRRARQIPDLDRIDSAGNVTPKG